MKLTVCILISLDICLKFLCTLFYQHCVGYLLGNLVPFDNCVDHDANNVI